MAPLNFSRTQRLLLLIDLHPLLTLQNPRSYLSAVTAVAYRLLQFPQISASLSAYKFFFSSLSPMRSATVLPHHLATSSISFNLPAETLASLCNSLNSIVSRTDFPNSPCCARASNTVSSLLQLTHDYAWERETDHMSGEGDFAKIPSNLVILLSPIHQSVSRLVDYLEFREFDDVFCVVREVFAVRDIHLCWIDVKCDEFKLEDFKKNGNECRDELISMKDGIGKMGWTFCSSDLIILGTALLPLGLIYPKVGMSFDFVDFDRLEKRKYKGELSLEILDVKGMPLECKCCDLEFLNLQSCPGGIKTTEILNTLELKDSENSPVQDSFWLRFGQENVKLHVKDVCRYEGCERIESLKEIVLVRESSRELGKNKKKKNDGLFEDDVLDMIHREMGGGTSKTQMPYWQIFLSFLHVKGYWALVSFTSCNGDTFMGSLKPFTSHLAILTILDVGCVQIVEECRFKLPEMDDNTQDTFNEINDSNRCGGSQTSTSTSSNYDPAEDGKKRKSDRRLYQEMTWSSFCKAAFSGSNFDLFELYFVRHHRMSKMLKFLKCWMKQITKVDPRCLATSSGPKFVEQLSASNPFMTDPSPAIEGAMPVLKLETSEIFFNDLPNRIQQGLESGMDLQNLAERIVKSSIHWLCHKFDNGTNPDGNVSCAEVVGDKLIGLLLRSPKEMMKIHQDFGSSSSSETIVREYELQVLLRMEILQSDVSAVMGESRKQKMLTQICSLLEIIQYLVDGGIHGHISLYDYVERTIKARYWDELEDVVKELYTKMDLLPFSDEDESPNLLFNSEDSNHSWRDKHDTNSINQSVSTEGESSQPLANLEDIEHDQHSRILNEARERREKARRFAPFISKVRDLQRVWAPKQSKAAKCKRESLPKTKSSKGGRSCGYNVVCETPMSEHKRPCSRGSGSGKSRIQNGVGSSSRSVSKALFQDD